MFVFGLAASACNDWFMQRHLVDLSFVYISELHFRDILAGLVEV